jgi:hypothetical protein
MAFAWVPSLLTPPDSLYPVSLKGSSKERQPLFMLNRSREAFHDSELWTSLTKIANLPVTRSSPINLSVILLAQAGPLLTPATPQLLSEFDRIFDVSGLIVIQRCRVS